MEVQILRELGRIQLDALKLAQRVRKEGFVVFEASIKRQRKLATAVIDFLEESGVPSLKGETQSPGTCMCIVDRRRFELDEIVRAATLEDQRMWEEDFTTTSLNTTSLNANSLSNPTISDTSHASDRIGRALLSAPDSDNLSAG